MEHPEVPFQLEPQLITRVLDQTDNISLGDEERVYTELEAPKTNETGSKTNEVDGIIVSNKEVEKGARKVKGKKTDKADKVALKKANKVSHKVKDQEAPIQGENVIGKEETIQCNINRELCINKRKLQENSVTAGVPEPLCSCKKVKFPENIDSLIENIVQSKRPVTAILSDDFYNPIPVTKVYVGQVKSVKDLSQIIVLLNQRLPLKELSHLKRAYRKEVILFPMSNLSDHTHSSIQKYIDKHIKELKNSFEYFKVMDLPATGPKIRKQFVELGRSWSLNFHPNKYYEQLYAGEMFTDEEIEQHRLFMGMTFEIAVYYMKKEKEVLTPYDILSADVNATVVVDPIDRAVVAVAFDNRINHPTQHSTMLAIDNVAKTQNGGVWNTSDIDSENLRGIGYMDLLLYLKHKYPNILFGARDYINKMDIDEHDLNASESPYLCTGYYIYMIREPCVMCAMGLVHARIKRVFFATKNTMGALTSLTKLHCVQSLNHHFEVFTEFL